MSSKTPKQQIIDVLKDSDTALVTVNTNPSVDELSAALGFTLLLNKLNKHATAVFSGDIPPAITFLDPEKTFENTVDSLRDFIIALDKEKADHLRYKVEGDMVKIFITPYRTTITNDDFDFSQGDYNVETVIAIGVQSEDDLDKALSDHGRILHDATVVGISLGETTSGLGTIGWHDDKASSYCEMLMSLTDELKNGKNPVDEQIATAYLTGIVAATDRFSNTRTNSSTMTVAAQLMAAGANQQLIATQLEKAEEVDEQEPTNLTDSSDTATGIEKKVPQSTKKSTKSKNKQETPVTDKPAADGTMTISHTKKGNLDDVSKQVEREQQAIAAQRAEEQLAEGLKKSEQTQAATLPSVEDLQNDIAKATDTTNEAINTNTTATASQQVPIPGNSSSPSSLSSTDGQSELQAPVMGGTLNATTEQAAEDKQRELEKTRNQTILSHDTPKVDHHYVGGSAVPSGGAASYGQSVNEPAPSTNSGAPNTQPSQGQGSFSQHAKTIAPPEPIAGPTLADIDKQNRSHEEARSAIDQALRNGVDQSSASSSSPAVGTQSAEQSATASPTIPQMPPMPDFSTLPQLPNDPVATPQADATPSDQQTSQTQPLSSPTTGVQDISDRLGDILPPAQPSMPPVQAGTSRSSDPAQFQIPGQ